MHWLIIADGGRARFFEGNVELDELTEIIDLVHPSARLRGTDVYTDGSGRRAGGSLTPHTDRKDVELDGFAREVASEAAKHIDAYERLIVAAPPQFLGRLRNQLTEQVRRKVVASVAKDFTSLDARGLSDAVRKNLPPTAGMP